MPAQLRDQLKALHQQLHESDSLDEESRELLVTLLDDINRVLERKKQPPTADEDTLGDRLEGAAVRFESEHPALANAVRSVVDALAKAGI